MSLETGTTSFLDRMGLTDRLEENLVPLLTRAGFSVATYGHPTILGHDGTMVSKIRAHPMKKSETALMVKFAPDFICLCPGPDDQPFFMDAKASITPVFFEAQINRIREASRDPRLRREDIGEIEREAWDTYQKWYPSDRVAVCFAAPYHPRLLVAEWASNMRELFRFAEDRNGEAGGSGTPHVNVNLGAMRPLDAFVRAEFGVDLDATYLAALHDYIKSWDLNKPRGRVNWTQFNNVVRSLQESCPWLKTRNEPETPQLRLLGQMERSRTGAAVAVGRKPTAKR